GLGYPERGHRPQGPPLWAGFPMLPLGVGFLLGGPVSGILTDRYGPRLFATGGMLGSAAAFVLLERLPTSFSYEEFAAVLLLMGLSMGALGAPNPAGGMNTPPARHPRPGAGVNQTFPNSRAV